MANAEYYRKQADTLYRLAQACASRDEGLMYRMQAMEFGARAEQAEHEAADADQRDIPDAHMIAPRNSRGSSESA
jgi:hypothetical protein